MTCEIHHFPSTALITADRDGQLTAALTISNRVFSGEWVGLEDMCDAREVIDSRTHAKATVAFLTDCIDARRDEIRKEARRITMRDALADCAGLAVIACVAVGVYLVGGT